MEFLSPALACALELFYGLSTLYEHMISHQSSGANLIIDIDSSLV